MPDSTPIQAFIDRARQGSGLSGLSKPRKKGSAIRGTADWDTGMERARQQAQSYARSLLPTEIAEGRLPFLLVVDVGHTIALYAEFTRSDGH